MQLFITEKFKKFKKMQKKGRRKKKNITLKLSFSQPNKRKKSKQIK